jgi:hypothetical protein
MDINIGQIRIRKISMFVSFWDKHYFSTIIKHIMIQKLILVISKNFLYLNFIFASFMIYNEIKV